MSYDMLVVDGVEQNNNGTNGNLSTEPEVTNEPPAADPAAEVTETTETTEEVEAPAEEPDSTLYWGDTAIEIEIPDDISSAFTDKGLDVQEVVKELFAKDGKFEVSEATRAKLDEAFGKTLVDGYLNLYKHQNQMAVDGFKKQEGDAKAAQEAAAVEFTELVGGDEGWSALDNWAADNLNEKELASFNAVMTLPPEHWAAQRAVLEALNMKRDAQVNKVKGDETITLLGDEGGGGKPSGGLPTQLTRSEFQEIIGSDKYSEDRAYAAQIDAIRRRSSAAGIS